VALPIRQAGGLYLNYYLDVWRGFADFSGRARRKEYWYFTLFHFIMALAGDIIAGAIYPENPVLGTAFGVIVLLYFLASIVPTIAVTVRRLHDVDKSGWWYFIAFIPFIGGIWLLVLTCTDGTAGPNQYGPDPKAVDVVAVV
jgi:uncharacterized membrane protein YhaH (DUF805 family)